MGPGDGRGSGGMSPAEQCTSSARGIPAPGHRHPLGRTGTRRQHGMADGINEKSDAGGSHQQDHVIHADRSSRHKDRPQTVPGDGQSARGTRDRPANNTATVLCRGSGELRERTGGGHNFLSCTGRRTTDFQAQGPMEQAAAIDTPGSQCPQRGAIHLAAQGKACAQPQ